MPVNAIYTVEQKIESIEAQLLDAVNLVSDEELFFASYLHGHFDLVIVHTLAQPEPSVSLMDRIMQQSLAKAFANGELDQEEQESVLALWQNLIKT